MKVAIIGTAGRGEDKKKMTKELFEAMVLKAEEIILNNFNLKKSEVELVSGGSAWADHVAVRIYINSMISQSYRSISIHLPCKFDFSSNSFENNDVGNRLQSLHSYFSKVIGFNSMQDFNIVNEMGEIINMNCKGFHCRNLEVGKVDYVIAFTWNDSNLVPNDGGTLHTWKNSKKSHKIHIPLITLMPKILKENENIDVIMNNKNNQIDNFFTKKKRRIS